MSRSSSSLLPFLLLCVLLLFSSSSSATTINVINQCPYPIWPGVQSNAGSITTEMSGFSLLPGKAFPVHAPYSWSGRIWARTMCSFDASTTNFSCATGGCASGAVACNGFGPKPPVTLAQFNLGSSKEDAIDQYDVSLADGFNVPLKVVPMVGFGGESSSDCKVAECASDVDVRCRLDKGGMTSPHICPTAKTPSFNLVFCAAVPVKQVPDGDGHPPTAPPPVNTVIPGASAPASTSSNLPPLHPPAPASTSSNLPPPHPPAPASTSSNLPRPPPPAPAPASTSSILPPPHHPAQASTSSSSSSNHKDLPEIGITISAEPPPVATSSASAPTPAPTPAPAPVSSTASTGHKKKTWLICTAAAVGVVALLALVIFVVYFLYFRRIQVQDQDPLEVV